MIINAAKVLNNLENEPLMFDDEKKIPLTFGRAAANILLTVQNSSKDPLKYFSLAQKFYNAKSVDSADQESLVELDDSDSELVKTSIANSEIYQTLVIGQMLKIISESK